MSVLKNVPLGANSRKPLPSYYYSYETEASGATSRK